MQQTQLKYKQLQSDYKDLHQQAEETEVRDGEWLEPNFDNSIVEQHLLQENDQLQKELNAANLRIEEAQSTIRKSEQVIANLKQHLIRQKEEFHRTLTEEQNKYAIAEKRISELESSVANATKQEPQLSLSPTPSTHPSKTAVFHVPPTPVKQTVHQPPPVQPAKPASDKPHRTTANRASRTKQGLFSKLVLIVTTLAIGLSVYLLWK